MNNEQLIAKLKEIVKPYTSDMAAHQNLTADTDFIKDLHINSSNLVDIVLDIEETFGIVIENADMERMLDVRTSVEIIQSKLALK